MNRVDFIGNLTRDVEVRSAGNAKVANFTVAIQRAYTSKDGQTADFVPCTAFGNQAEVAEKYLAKGSKIGVEGELKTRNFEDKEGKKQFRMEVNVQRIEFLSTKRTEESASAEDTEEEEELNF